MDKALKEILSWMSLLVGIAFLTTVLPQQAAAQDYDDPPSRVARLGYMQGSVSFQPAGESDWIQAVPNRPMTTGDRLWADQNSRAEVQLGSAVIRLAANTGFSFLNLDDRTMQIQLTSGLLNINVRRLDRNDVFEVDTPNLAFSVFQPGRYRVEASGDGNYTVISVREGEGESTGNGQTYTLHAGQRGTFSGIESLNADVVQIGGPDDFDNWAYSRDRRSDQSRSAQYLSHDVVGYEDLDDYGDWRSDSNYGHVWYPTRVSDRWAPYREGHWDWISPWGWTWVDDAPWGYAPFHYGRWVTIGGRWGWVAGPINIVPVYAPALVVFIGTGGIGFGGHVGWFPLGPREVYVPSYYVSREYMNRVNISNTTVNNVTITNVYNTTIVNKSTSLTNITYQNRNVAGAVTAVPQRTFVNAQPVAAVAVAMDARETASGPVSSRAAVTPSRESVLGSRVNNAGRVAAPPPAVASRQVIAKEPPPPPPVPFAKQQQALATHPGQPLERNEVQTLRPAIAPAEQSRVKLAPPGKQATPNMNRSGNQPGNSPNAGKPGQPADVPSANRPGNKPAPSEPPAVTNPARPNARPEAIRPTEPAPQVQTPPPSERTQQPAPAPGRQATPNVDRPGNQPGNSPNAGKPGQPADVPSANRPGNKPAPSEPPAVTNPARPNTRPETIRPTEPAPRVQTPPPSERTQQLTPAPGRQATPNVDRPGSQPGNSPNAGKPGQPADVPSANRPGNKPAPSEPPAVTNPARPNARPEAIRPTEPAPQVQTPPPSERTQQITPAPGRQATPNVDRPGSQPGNLPNVAKPGQPANAAPAKTGPELQQQKGQKPKPLTAEEKKLEEQQKKLQDEQRKRDEKPQPPQ